uniref:Sorting nexin 10a n=1 Tax=Seriola lalandi dorsalis TaxID=1841481 RepID=A0A3B4WQZ1_SERLL
MSTQVKKRSLWGHPCCITRTGLLSQLFLSPLLELRLSAKCSQSNYLETLNQMNITITDDLWHTHVDYEICLQTNSMCFRKKTSCVRRRYSEFVWLRHCLEQNALIMELPKLPHWNPFFSLRNTEQVSQRMKGLQGFLESVLHTPLLLSDSRLHLFLQSDLSITKIERCAHGKTRYTVAEAIQRSSRVYISGSEDKGSCDSDCERYGLCPTSTKATIQLTSAESWNLSCYCRWLLMYHICCLVYVHVDILLC